MGGGKEVRNLGTTLFHAEKEVGQHVSDFGRVGSWVSVSRDPVFDPVLSFKHARMFIVHGVVSTEQHHLAKLISAVSVSVSVPVTALYRFTYFS